MNYLLSLTVICLSGFSSSLFAQTHPNKTTYLFIGTYTHSKPSKGIYIYSFNPDNGALTFVSNGENITNPSYITLAPDGCHLYACTETQLPNAGSVSAFGFDSVHGCLTFINKQHSGGENPVYASVDKANKWLVNANYTQGSVSVFPLNDNGSLGIADTVLSYLEGSIDTPRQSRAHVHSVVFSPQQDHLFAPDLGADKIRGYTFDANRKHPLQPADPQFTSTVPGSGPRHFIFHPNGRLAYCTEELSGTISAYSYDDEKLQRIQRLASYAAKQEWYAGSDIHISPDGLFLYASNREEEHSISIFSIDTTSGLLTLIGHQKTGGKHPRMFTIDPTGNYLLVANLFSNNIVVFKRDQKTGLLARTHNTIKVPQPSCLQMRTYDL